MHKYAIYDTPGLLFHSFFCCVGVGGILGSDSGHGGGLYKDDSGFHLSNTTVLRERQQA